MSPRRLCLLLVVLAVLLPVGTSGCSPINEPFLDEIDRAALAELGFAQQGDLVESCGAQLGFGCAEPLYELVFRAPSTASLDDSCGWIVDSAVDLGAPIGYASNGGEAGPWPDDLEVVRSFCVEGLTEPMPDPAGPPFYQGTLVVDAGSDDGIGKNFIITRDPDGAFVITIAASRDLNRIGAFVGSSAPRHLSREDVESNAQLLDELAEAQQLANTLIGMTEDDAVATLEAAGYTHYDLRTASQTDVDPRRVGLASSDGIVLDAIAG